MLYKIRYNTGVLRKEGFVISVVMTTFNGENFIKAQLESVLKQSVRPDEVIIADDASSDSTPRIVRAFIEENNLDNWHLEVNERNKGWRVNFVEAACRAKGDLIFFCDQDDVWMSHKLQVMSEVMCANAQIDVLVGQYVEFYGDAPGRVPENINLHPKGEAPEQVQADNHIFNTEYPGCVYCVRASFWRRIYRHWDGVFAHDGMCWSAAKLLGTLYILDVPVIFWRKHYNSAYTVTCREMKTNAYRVRYLSDEQTDTAALLEIMKDFGAPREAAGRVERYAAFNALRIKMLSKHNPFLIFKLLKYKDCYNRARQLPLEVYLSLRRN